MLDLDDPMPEEPDEGGSPRLRLVPKGPKVAFRRIENPETSWQVRAIGLLLALLLSIVGVSAILQTAALLKEYYDRVDAIDQARALARARERAAREAASRPRGDGAIVLSLPGEPGKSSPAADPNLPR